MLNSYRLAITEIIAWPKHTSQTRHCSRLFRLLVFPDLNVDHFEDYNLGQNKWNIWTTPPPVSMMPKWRAVAPSCLQHCFGGKGENCSISSVQDCRLSRTERQNVSDHPRGVFPVKLSQGVHLFLILFISKI